MNVKKGRFYRPAKKPFNKLNGELRAFFGFELWERFETINIE